MRTSPALNLVSLDSNSFLLRTHDKSLLSETSRKTGPFPVFFSSEQPCLTTAFQSLYSFTVTVFTSEYCCRPYSPSSQPFRTA